MAYIARNTRAKGWEGHLKDLQKVHGDRYTYLTPAEWPLGKVGVKTMITIICPEHGEFVQRIDVHKRGCGCPLCGFELTHGKSLRYTDEAFYQELEAKMGDRFEYPRGKYLVNYDKFPVKCRKHGTTFYPNPAYHLRNESGCHECAVEGMRKSRIFRGTEGKRLTWAERLDAVAKKQGWTWKSRVPLGELNSQTRITRICPIHGEREVRVWSAAKLGAEGTLPICCSGKRVWAVRRENLRRKAEKE